LTIHPFVHPASHPAIQPSIHPAIHPSTPGERTRADNQWRQAKLPETGPVLGCRQASYFTPSQWCALGKIGGIGPFFK